MILLLIFIGVIVFIVSFIIKKLKGKSDIEEIEEIYKYDYDKKQIGIYLMYKDSDKIDQIIYNILTKKYEYKQKKYINLDFIDLSKYDIISLSMINKSVYKKYVDIKNDDKLKIHLLRTINYLENNFDKIIKEL